MKSTGAWSSNELQWPDFIIGHQDRCPNNGHQSDILDPVLSQSIIALSLLQPLLNKAEGSVLIPTIHLYLLIPV